MGAGTQQPRLLSLLTGRAPTLRPGQGGSSARSQPGPATAPALPVTQGDCAGTAWVGPKPPLSCPSQELHSAGRLRGDHQEVRQGHHPAQPVPAG